MAAGDTLQGKRIEGGVAEMWDAEPGSYAPIFNDAGELEALWMKLPTGSLGRIPNIGHGQQGPEWTITEEEDGSITVDPSIEQHPVPGDPPTPYWHGYLERGTWREV